MDQTPGKSRADTQPSSVPEVLLQTLLDMDPKLHDVWINLKPLQEALCMSLHTCSILIRFTTFTEKLKEAIPPIENEKPV